MATPTTEAALLQFCDLLNRYRANGDQADLMTALATIDAAMRRGWVEVAELMAAAVRATTGMAVTIGDPSAWPTERPN